MLGAVKRINHTVNKENYQELRVDRDGFQEEGRYWTSHRHVRGES